MLASSVSMEQCIVSNTIFDDNNNLVLVSANPELRHTNIFVSADSGRSVKACGKVLLKEKIDLPDYLFED